MPVKVTCRLPPSVWGGSRSTLNVPPTTVPVPTISPEALRTVTVVPVRPEPVRVSPRASTASPVGAGGASGSGACTAAGSDMLPAVSSRTTCRASPLIWAGASGTLNVPSVSTVPVPMIVPPAFRTVTSVFGSPTPVSVSPSSLTTSSVGGAGG
ncbi:hypothetical protein D3C73_505390 [compost metagenome]